MRINRIMTLMAGMTFFMFAPLALAAVQIAFTSAPASEYRVYEGGTYDVSITMTEITDDTKVRMYVKGPIGEASEAEEMIEEYEYIANGMHTFSWDGQFSGGYVPAGDYELRFDGTALIGSNPNTLAHDFSVTDPVRLVLNEELPSLYYTTSPDDLEFSYHLDAVSNSCVRLNINNGSDTYLSPYEIGGTGDYVISWDGEIMGSEAPEGEYDWLLFVDGICSPVNNDGIEGTITVSNDAEPSPVLSDVT
ncbi:MAG TPA: hypothetical protein VI588_01415, partial [Candidatus Gracilibacteria bacterium]|nr:hypothetical protein [Candidatus Gracilibacteria bacterium]